MKRGGYLCRFLPEPSLELYENLPGSVCPSRECLQARHLAI